MGLTPFLGVPNPRLCTGLIATETKKRTNGGDTLQVILVLCLHTTAIVDIEKENKIVFTVKYTVNNYDRLLSWEAWKNS
jgi:hypothetical protein